MSGDRLTKRGPGRVHGVSDAGPCEQALDLRDLGGDGGRASADGDYADVWEETGEVPSAEIEMRGHLT